jgi:hypothetical protein
VVEIQLWLGQQADYLRFRARKNHKNLRVTGEIFILVARVLVIAAVYQSCGVAVGAM